MPEGVLRRRLNQIETLDNFVIGTLVFGILPTIVESFTCTELPGVPVYSHCTSLVQNPHELTDCSGARSTETRACQLGVVMVRV